MSTLSRLINEYPLLIFSLEAVLGLFILVFIVVWMSRRKKRAADNRHRG